MADGTTGQMPVARPGKSASLERGPGLLGATMMRNDRAYPKRSASQARRRFAFRAGKPPGWLEGGRGKCRTPAIAAAFLLCAILLSCSQVWADVPTPSLDARRASIIAQPDARLRMDGASQLATEYEKAGKFSAAAKITSVGVEAAAHLQDLPNLMRLAAREVLFCRSAHEIACEAGALVNLANGESLSGFSLSALNRYEAAVNLYQRAGRPNEVVWARFNAAGARYDLGDASGALAELLEIQPIMVQASEGEILTFDVALAEVFVHTRRPEDALSLCGQVDELLAARPAASGRRYSSSDPQVKCDAVRGLASARLRRADAAAAAFAHAMALAASPLDRFQTGTAQAQALLDLARPDAALLVVEQLAPVAKRMGVIEERDFHDLAARVYKAAGRPGLALEEQMATAELRVALYRGNIAEAVATSDIAIALSERRAAADLLSQRNLEERSAFRKTIQRTVLTALLAIIGLLVAGGAIAAVSRARQRRARELEIATERARMAADVHDTLLQSLIGISMQVRAAAMSAEGSALAARLQTIATQAGNSLDEARRAVTRLHGTNPPASQNLAHSLGTWLLNAPRPDGLALTFDADNDLPSMGPDRTEELHRVVQEATTNALRHSGGTHVRVGLRATSGGIEATISDDGAGFSPHPPAAAAANRWGLRLMQERMTRIGGVLHVRSIPGEGTLVTALVPC